MMYFRKTAPLVKFLLRDGSRVQFKRVGANLAVLEADNTLGQQILASMKAGVGGIAQITVDEYNDLKKNTYREGSPDVLTPQVFRQTRLQEVQRAQPSPPVSPVATNTEAAPSALPELPTTPKPVGVRRPSATRRR